MNYYYIPIRLLDENFTQGVMGVTEKGAEVNYDFPKLEIATDATKSKTLWDYLKPNSIKIGGLKWNQHK